MLKLWRAPHGSYNRAMLYWVAEEGYTHVKWTVETFDWVAYRKDERYMSGQTISANFNRDLERGADGYIFLFHLETFLLLLLLKIILSIL